MLFTRPLKLFTFAHLCGAIASGGVMPHGPTRSRGDHHSQESSEKHNDFALSQLPLRLRIAQHSSRSSSACIWLTRS